MSEEVEEDCPEKSSRGEQSNSRAAWACILQNSCSEYLFTKLMISSPKGEDWHEGDARGVHL